MNMGLDRNAPENIRLQGKGISMREDSESRGELGPRGVVRRCGGR